MLKTGLIFKKDFTEFIRDRKHFILTVLGPFILYPLLFICLGYFTHIENTREQSSIHTVGFMEPFLFESGLLDSLKKNLRIEIKSCCDSLIINTDVLLFSRQTEKRNEIVIYYRGAEAKSRNALHYIRTLMEVYQKHRISENLINCHLDDRILNPFTIISENISSNKKMGGYMLGFLIPYLLFLICFSSAITIACDITAGEKERRTLETLLVTDISKGEIVMGKIWTTFSISLLSGISGFMGLVLSFLTGFSFLNMEQESVVVSVPWLACIKMLLFMLPFLWFCASLLIAVGTFARNLKEAQTYCYYTFFLGMIPGGLSVTRITAPDPLQYWVPFLNTTLLQQQMLTGEAGNVQCMTVVGLNLLSAVVMGYLAKKMFERESVLFRI